MLHADIQDIQAHNSVTDLCIFNYPSIQMEKSASVMDGQVAGLKPPNSAVSLS